MRLNVKLKFQVVIMNKRDYILEYKDFGENEMETMGAYVTCQALKKGSTINITRWNDKGERA